MISEYEKQRAINIEKNRALLQELGLEKPMLEPKEKRRKPAVTTKKRKAVTEENTDETRKIPKLDDEQPATPPAGVRRSTRNAGKRVDYEKEKEIGLPAPLFAPRGNVGPMGRETGKRKHDPKRFGGIPGIEIGTWWESRQGCSADAVHAPWVAGISGGPDGAYSVVVSGGYDNGDDVDLGYAFTYTGSGGRDLKGTKANPKNLRTAPQSCDQTFENNFNKSLKRSIDTKKPVRVVRGFKSNSRYAPSEGYRYDGLYQVEKAWMAKGRNPGGYLVCKFAFKRIPGQPPIPVRDDGDGAEEAADQSDSPSEE